jgi:predicted DNA-binding ribbon-helix-helix protein
MLQRHCSAFGSKRDTSNESAIVKRSVIIAGHKTSVSVEDAFWKELKANAGERDMNLSELITSIDSDRQHSNLSSAIRLYETVASDPR